MSSPASESTNAAPIDTTKRFKAGDGFGQPPPVTDPGVQHCATDTTIYTGLAASTSTSVQGASHQRPMSATGIYSSSGPDPASHLPPVAGARPQHVFSVLAGQIETSDVHTLRTSLDELAGELQIWTGQHQVLRHTLAAVRAGTVKPALLVGQLRTAADLEVCRSHIDRNDIPADTTPGGWLQHVESADDEKQLCSRIASLKDFLLDKSRAAAKALRTDCDRFLDNNIDLGDLLASLEAWATPGKRAPRLHSLAHPTSVPFRRSQRPQAPASAPEVADLPADDSPQGWRAHLHEAGAAPDLHKRIRALCEHLKFSVAAQSAALEKECRRYLDGQGDPAQVFDKLDQWVNAPDPLLQALKVPTGTRPDTDSFTAQIASLADRIDWSTAPDPVPPETRKLIVRVLVCNTRRSSRDLSSVHGYNTTFPAIRKQLNTQLLTGYTKQERAKLASAVFAYPDAEAFYQGISKNIGTALRIFTVNPLVYDGLKRLAKKFPEDPQGFVRAIEDQDPGLFQYLDGNSPEDVATHVAIYCDRKYIQSAAYARTHLPPLPAPAATGAATTTQAADDDFAAQARV